MNGGFGLVLDGSPEAAGKASAMLNWDVSNGVARRWDWADLQPGICPEQPCIATKVTFLRAPETAYFIVWICRYSPNATLRRAPRFHEKKIQKKLPKKKI
jgi:hypothetical protein